MNSNLYNGNYIPNIPNVNNYHGNYVEDYLKNNLGRKVEVHASFCDSIDWRDSIFAGILESIGKDYIVIKENNKTYVIWNVYLDYLVLL